jgi:hypothetical protein
MSVYQNQKAVKPKIEDVAAELLDGNKQANLMDLLGFLKDDKLTPRWQSSNTWAVKHKKKGVCHIRIYGGDKGWIAENNCHTAFNEKDFLRNEKFVKAITENKLNEFILDNINNSARCREGCGAKNITILGKTFDVVCGCWPLTVRNPDGAALENEKKFILTIKNLISDLER